MKRETVRLTALAAVGLLLLTALPALAWGPPRGGGGPPPDRFACLAFIPGITAVQLQAVSALREEHLEAVRELRDEMYEAKTALRELMRQRSPDLAAVRRAKERLDKLESDMLVARLELRTAVRNLLTEEQRAFFDEMEAGCGWGMGPGMGPGGPGMGPSGPGMGPGWRSMPDE
ncbi:MAG TPA: periplasmic heavy metal sensor [Candidatus Coatesbacteria bacterium]|mgnify:CR=1 FL=1|nr:periplasmic heavy metal sensor [Candidatus Coatesbacteria bacterium]